MSFERNIMAVVTDLVSSGLSVEQQILLNELVMLTASLQADADAHRERREAERNRQRSVRQQYRTVANPPHPQGNNNIKKITPPPPLDADFEIWWGIYPRREGKRAALKAYRHAVKRGADKTAMLNGARREAKAGKERQFTKMPATWLNADCWLDEPDKPKSTILAGPWKPIEREPEGPVHSEEERQANLEKLAKIRFKGKGINAKNG